MCADERQPDRLPLQGASADELGKLKQMLLTISGNLRELCQAGIDILLQRGA